MDRHLILHWHETKPGNEAKDARHELLIAMFRLNFALEELTDNSDVYETNLKLRRLEYHIENCLVRLFELRERAILLMAILSGNAKLTGMLRRPDMLNNAYSIIEENIKDCLEPIQKLLALLHDDIALRNLQTHEAFLYLVLYDGNSIHNPETILDNLEESPEELQSFEKFMQKEFTELRSVWEAKTNNVTQATMDVLRSADKYILKKE